ncbi:MAG: zinc ribbon domain-containing protein [Treponema sp.]|nr:zinc ribbon domain-containing protein [Treponema sp.]
MAKNTKAKFFCQNCGSEVPENAKLCTKCGKFFISVRCPSCGYTGTSKEFKEGCPQCGYAMGKKKQTAFTTTDRAKALNMMFSNAKAYSNQKAVKHSESLPVWIYAFTFSLLCIVVFGIYSCIK